LFSGKRYYLSVFIFIKNKPLKRFIFSLAFLLPFLAQGQAHHEVGLSVGVANYYGDLQDKLFPGYGYKPMGGVSYKYFMSPRVGIRLGANYANLTGADSLSEVPVKRQRNLRFATHLFEVSAGLEVNLWPIDLDRRSRVTPYIFGGVSAFYTNPYADGPRGERVYLRPLSTEGQGIPTYPDRKQYGVINAAFPIGGGMKFFMGRTLVMTTELGFRYTNTDYIDDVSKSYVNLDTLMAYRSQLAVQMAYRGNTVQGADPNYHPNYQYQRGDSRANDWFWFGSVTVAVYLEAFGNLPKYIKTKCLQPFSDN
jgi:hypothetical protein